MSRFVNYYVHCGQVWTDEWDCMCNDECPVCRGEIEPFASVDEDGDTQMHVRPDFVPQGGWPEGVTNLEELIEVA